MARSGECQVPECNARTLRDYCVLCTVSGRALAHVQGEKKPAEDDE